VRETEQGARVTNRDRERSPNVAEEQEPVDAALAECEPNERLAIDLALGGMASRGWIDEPEDTELLELIATLRKVYANHPLCQQEINLTGESWHDLHAARPAEYLLGAYERYCQERWMREEAEHWSCPCGETFALCGYDPERPDFWTLGSDDLFVEPVTKCPRCTRELPKAHQDAGQGQLALGF
jgi:hypothetical protein